jgi:hypothetical protein
MEDSICGSSVSRFYDPFRPAAALQQPRKISLVATPKPASWDDRNTGFSQLSQIEFMAVPAQDLWRIEQRRTLACMLNPRQKLLRVPVVIPS